MFPIKKGKKRTQEFQPVVFLAKMCYLLYTMLEQIKKSFKLDKVLYTGHAKDEMGEEEFGEIKENEVFEAVVDGKVIENYPDDKPYPSCLIYGKTLSARPLHVVCAYSEEDEMTVIVTVYQPHPDRWINFERRKQ
ncbi:MAG: DUF4258 domain-containing protein [Candidatus Aminicenantes bacterium]|nr:DUF4258 domain-containing protein [Candidatus Aminicenantes bacterium]NIM78775.1 DUF4258 domain-containing protein [Candidatus Aminicenantes bacterium]NIN18030.1 DUF4258 domain-containing protein [Candidatus Aminicenantes bacterium]NIN41930.1 DUF4258 domain-containing protein [Candidatus Aminicenantes bacterium]NIN84685.1 DUF4258 domain-containing protein [Candidatus Aminicenantes bacterium]